MTDLTETPTAKAEPKNVTEAIARIMEELPAIGKAVDPSGGVKYAFRGIEVITAHAQALCAKYGVVFFPSAELKATERITVNGNPWTDTFLSVEYEVCHGPSDTSKFVKVPGIGRDNSDKGSNKAMTQAFKYALIQTFMIADPKDDGDAEDHATSAAAASTVRREPPVRPSSPTAPARAALNGDANGISDAQLRKIAVEFKEKGFPDDRSIRHAYAALIVGREFESTKDLTKKEASALIEALIAEPVQIAELEPEELPF